MSMYLFVGENPSKKALDKGWRWKDGRLAAKQLFDALDYCKIKGDEQEYCNVLSNCGNKVNYLILHKIRSSKLTVVAMGNKVSDVLSYYEVAHTKIPHPAARGKIRKKLTYCKIVKTALKAAHPTQG